MKRSVRGDVLLFAVILLLGVVAFVSKKYSLAKHAHIKATITQLSVLQVALDQFHKDCETFPDEAAGIDALLRDPGTKGWNGPYVKTNTFHDAWNNTITYSLENEAPRITSPGPDKTPNTADDMILKWKTNTVNLVDSTAAPSPPQQAHE